MIDRSPNDRMPGAWLLTLGRLIFDQSVLDTVIRPTVADLQRELRDAGSNRTSRAMARWRGYRAFWTLALIAPFAFWGAPVPGRAPIAFPDLAARIAVTVMLLTLATVRGSAIGIWAIVVGIGGSVFAVVIHHWYSRHPLSVAVPESARSRRPEINMSSIPVGANPGGLLFVCGSTFAVLAGLPMARWFLFVTLVLGVLCAWALMAWHASHPFRGLPENRIVLR
jgi:hypothetical protein